VGKFAQKSSNSSFRCKCTWQGEQGPPSRVGRPPPRVTRPCSTPSTSLIHHKPRKHTFKSSWALVWWRFDPRAGVECHIDWSDRHRNWTRDLAPNQPWVTANCHWECLYTIGLDGDASKVSGNLPLGQLTPQGAIASPLSPTSTHMAPTHYKYVCWRHGRASLKIKERRSSRS
jgi:hypothetical protein